MGSVAQAATLGPVLHHPHIVLLAGVLFSLAALRNWDWAVVWELPMQLFMSVGRVVDLAFHSLVYQREWAQRHSV